MPKHLYEMTISELIAFAKKQAEIELKTPSLIAADDPTRYASWADTLEILKIMKEGGMPDSLRDPANHVE